MSGILEAVSFRDFWTDDQIRGLVAQYIERLVARYRESAGQAGPIDVQSLRSLLIFSTSKQQTWLVTDDLSLRCILDDRRKEEPRVQLSIKREEVEPLRANYDYSRASGVLHFGGSQKGWLFSKSLFQSVDVTDAVRRLLAAGAG
jgi:hypothetical protein